MHLNGNTTIKYNLGILDDFKDVSVKDWAEHLLMVQFSEMDAMMLFEGTRSDFTAEYERYKNWMEQNLCRSNVNFDDYYALLMKDSLDSNDLTFSNLEQFDEIFSEEEFRELERKAVSYLEEKGKNAFWDDKGYVLGHHLAAFLFYLYYSIDEKSMEIVNILFSKGRMYEEKIKEAVKVKLLKTALTKAMNEYCYSWEVLREGRVAMEFALGFFNHRFYTSGSVISICAVKSALSQYSDNLLDYFITKDEKYLSEGTLSGAKELLDEINKTVHGFKAKQKELSDKRDHFVIDEYNMKSYIPYSAREKDEQLDSINDKLLAEYYWYFMEIQGLMSSADLMLNILGNRDIDPENMAYSEDDVNDLCDEIEFERNDMIRLVYENARKAKRAMTEYSIEKIEANENRLIDCWRLLDILEGMIDTMTLESADKYMRLKKEIVEQIQDTEEGTLLQERSKHITSLMERRVEELNENSNKIDSLTEEIEQYVGSLQNIITDFLIPLSGGEILYSMFVDHHDANPDFDYSCVTIMYYTALETIMKQYLFNNYLKKVGIWTDDGPVLYDGHIAREKNLTYLKNQGKIVSQDGHSWISDRCELGKFKKIYCSEVLEQVQELRDYINDDLGIDNLDDLIGFCERVDEIRSDRNRAAHGMSIVTCEDTIKAKKDTYIKELDTMNGMIIEFIRMINC